MLNRHTFCAVVKKE